MTTSNSADTSDDTTVEDVDKAINDTPGEKENYDKISETQQQDFTEADTYRANAQAKEDGADEDL